jgi:hypothetical protein
MILDCAIIRPMESDGGHFLTDYLANEDDKSTEQFKGSRDHEQTHAT